MHRPQHGQLWWSSSCGDVVQGAWLAPVLLKLLQGHERLLASEQCGAADTKAAKLLLPRTRCQSLSMAARIRSVRGGPTTVRSLHKCIFSFLFQLRGIGCRDPSPSATGAGVDMQ